MVVTPHQPELFRTNMVVTPPQPELLRADMVVTPHKPELLRWQYERGSASTRDAPAG